MKMSMEQWWNDIDRVKQRHSEKNLSQCPPQTSHGLSWNRTRASAVRDRRHTAIAMAQSSCDQKLYLLYIYIYIYSYIHIHFVPHSEHIRFPMDTAISECSKSKGTVVVYCHTTHKYTASYVVSPLAVSACTIWLTDRH